jgi:hypothetical protein
MDVNNEVAKHTFLQGIGDLASSVNNSASDHPNCGDVRLTSLVLSVQLIRGSPKKQQKVKLVRFETALTSW